MIQRAGLDAGGLQDLVHTGRRVALPCGTAGPRFRPGRRDFDPGGASLDNTRKVAQELADAAARVRRGRTVRLARSSPTPRSPAPEQALVRPLAVACCDLDVAVCQGRLPMPPGHAVGHEGVAEVVAVGDAVRDVRVGDRVVVPFQISCGQCRACRRGVTGSCASLPLMAMYGMAPLAGLDGGGFMADLVLVPYADAMLLPVPGTSTRSRSLRCRTTFPTAGAASARTGRSWPASMPPTAASSWSAGCRSACTRRRSRPRSALRSTTSTPTTNRLAAAEKLGAAVHDRPKPDKSWDPYPVTVHTSADPALLAATLRATWPDGVCTDTGIYYQAGGDAAAADVHPRGAIRDRPGQRTGGHPGGSRTARRGCDLSPAWSASWPGRTRRRCGPR